MPARNAAQEDGAPIRPGLCSITLRQLPVEEVLAVAAEAGLHGVEWGSDVHAPAGDEAEARRVARLTAAAGLVVTSLGSYYRAGTSTAEEFEDVLRTARALEAPRIRIWAGSVGSAEAGTEERRAVAEATRHAADRAADEGIELGFEYHAGTLTDDIDSTLALLADVDRANVTSYWQPPNGMPAEDALATLRRLGDQVRAVHVFSWWPDTQRLPLAERSSLWREAFAYLAGAGSGTAAGSGETIDALMEFVPDDDPANVVRDAAVLHELIPHLPPD
ncbi:sugar phosphate isomerase/epimerase [Actinobacteria bacterium YIM 96077]|uniref:Sugar phosphate isomerase/epimerase n=1 Tax=Phytoactinopolyspora halophila TaxID=1981511 RepID=A0A329QYQ1_9ACTN|nr:TIM barrel protein [Phytoactinopolyspora halophila]AYY13253.1 sugar phosphate isomerase/epimerase [Actinobacteria bacterium YIM 96077]RAW17510.1 sugar phosphate isomerase/epimerase [Phytoactinopolyspora halophila]